MQRLTTPEHDGGMKWLIWSPAIAIIFLAATVPGGLALFGVPMLAVGYFVVAVIALAGSADYRADPRARAVRGQRTVASDLPPGTNSDEKGARPPRAGDILGASGLSGTTTRRRTA